MQAGEVDQIPKIHGGLAGSEGWVRLTTHFRQRRQTDDPIDCDRTRVVQRPPGSRRIVIQGDPATVDQDGRAIREDERRDQDVACFVAPSLHPDLVPDGDLVGKIETTRRLDSPVFHARQAGCLARTNQGKRRGGLHCSQVVGKGLVLAVATHLPEAKKDGQTNSDQHQQSGCPPAPGKHQAEHQGAPGAGSFFFKGRRIRL